MAVQSHVRDTDVSLMMLITVEMSGKNAFIASLAVLCFSYCSFCILRNSSWRYPLDTLFGFNVWGSHSDPFFFSHNNDVIMSTMTSQITSLTIVYSTVYSGADQRKYHRSASLAFARGIHRSPVNSPHKGPVTRKKFRFDYVRHVVIRPEYDRSIPHRQILGFHKDGFQLIVPSQYWEIMENTNFVSFLKIIPQINGWLY